VNRNPLSLKNRCWFWTKVGVWLFAWGTPLGAIGIAFCVLIVTVPIGLFFIGLAAWPLAHMILRRTEEVKKWQTSPTPGLTIRQTELIMKEAVLTDSPWDGQ
jgi:hypothetical protein